MDNSTKLAGQVVVPAGFPSFRTAVLHVYVEDVSAVDDSALIVAHRQLTVGDHKSGLESRFGFQIESSTLDETRSYTLRAHLVGSQRSSMDVATGDLLTTQSYPVSSGTLADFHVLHLQQV